MAITINDLNPEYSLFLDRESYLDELVDNELRDAIGGVTPGAAILTALVIFGAGAGFGVLVYKLTH
ncbi:MULTISPECIES: hypothetical protein [unclassified Nostoc]|uniref:hypothetical protein n=1 Tax=unclassified Nostoc TaxID=2593658 RepID=UPI0015C3A388|nr:hypothetical protein [Nostoc sp. C052]QLE42553.1 hypothetical protein FD723_20370 [Nostoc sp. C052]